MFTYKNTKCLTITTLCHIFANEWRSLIQARLLEMMEGVVKGRGHNSDTPSYKFSHPCDKLP